MAQVGDRRNVNVDPTSTRLPPTPFHVRDPLPPIVQVLRRSELKLPPARHPAGVSASGPPRVSRSLNASKSRVRLSPKFQKLRCCTLTLLERLEPTDSHP